FTGVTAMGVNMGGKNNILRENLFSRIGGFRGNDNTYAIGINNPGANCLVENNMFFNMRHIPSKRDPASYEGVGVIVSADTNGCEIRNNRFISLYQKDHLYGVWVSSNASANVHNNVFRNFYFGVAADTTLANVHDNSLKLDKLKKGSMGLS